MFRTFADNLLWGVASTFQLQEYCTTRGHRNCPLYVRLTIGKKGSLVKKLKEVKRTVNV